MDPDKLPCSTEFSYAHLFMTHPQLGASFWIPPINPNQNMNPPPLLPELQIQNDKMKQPTARNPSVRSSSNSRRPRFGA